MHYAGAVTASPSPGFATVFNDRLPALGPRPAEFMCSCCDVVANSLNRELPLGWNLVHVDGRQVVICDDCDAAARKARPAPLMVELEGTLDTPLVVDASGWAIASNPAGGVDLSYFLYRGARVGHWPMPETQSVALYLVGGTAQGARQIDDAVLFQLDRPALRDLIEHLQAIEASITPSPAAGSVGGRING